MTHSVQCFLSVKYATYHWFVWNTGAIDPNRTTELFYVPYNCPGDIWSVTKQLIIGLIITSAQHYQTHQTNH
jgi:hypothetical protein